MVSPFEGTGKGYSNILPKNEFPETAMVPTHIKCSVYEHFVQRMFKQIMLAFPLARAYQEKRNRQELATLTGF